MAVDKAKHAFGASSRISEALASGAIDAFDILFLDGDTDNPKVGWIDKDGNVIIVPSAEAAEDEVIVVDALPAAGKSGVVYIVGNEVHIWDGAKFVKISESTDLSAFEGRVSALETNVSTLEGDAASAKEEVSAINGKVSALESDIASVKSEVATKASAEEVDALESVVAAKADAEKVVALETEVATKANAEQVAADIAQAKADAVADANAYADKQAAAVLDKCLGEKYEITSTPKGTLVDYRDKEIRVMVPAGTQWVKQSVGANGNANMYYMGFKAYAPEGAVSFKEDDLITIEDQTMYYFEGNDFAGTDKYGRKYSIVWLALAMYDEASGTWSYFGEKSSTEKYIGWYYSVEWYDADGVVIASDRIRINLSNEACHSEIKPFYMSDVEAEIKKYTDELIEAKVEEISEIPVVEF